jgi:hypothetical protein
MEKPELSPDFTVDDIRKLRDYNSSRHVNMAFEDIQDELKESVQEFEKLMRAHKKDRAVVSSK